MIILTRMTEAVGVSFVLNLFSSCYFSSVIESAMAVDLLLGFLQVVLFIDLDHG